MGAVTCVTFIPEIYPKKGRMSTPKIREADTKEIKKRMIDLDLTMRKLTEELKSQGFNISRAAVSMTILGYRHNLKLQKAIAKRLGISLDRAFPYKKR